VLGVMRERRQRRRREEGAGAEAEGAGAEEAKVSLVARCWPLARTGGSYLPFQAPPLLVTGMIATVAYTC